MEEYYIYCGLTYNTEADLLAGIEEMKNRLENNPTDYAKVEKVTANPDGGWVMEGIYLTDTGIKNLVEGEHYSIASGISGANYLGLTKSETEEILLTMRQAYAESLGVNRVEHTRVFAPTNIDMSVYL